ncbi:WXG100 family type VII secretion target [Catenulispora sp. NF23]|uniref:WXG100 family type VII secretion target n=1 Tax=Catenulispora pinistramenti TaxID=2705254 RepID=A0ABS5KLB1_9ACTN|nr:WXG100 family type VII secretion target [Catenulispora pinistramenti]MBS2531555.1 WXG100 family type VII secretion target [Catenulispora pinistramenti]MBS2546825.1 WXG100 family type VII secretion target [Catenulispora pinistramenti]
MVQTTGDPVEMAKGASRIDQTVNSAEGLLKAVNGYVDAMPWSGPSAQKYLQVVVAWEKQFADVIVQLSNMRDTLKGTGIHYDANEQANDTEISKLQAILDGA